MATPEQYLRSLLDNIDVPTGMYEAAEDRYQAVAEWLNADGSAVAAYEPKIYPQGSFALGTVVRPLAGDDYDVDVVCLMRASRTSISPRVLKQLIGDRLREHARYSKMLKPEGRRCWTLEYAESARFHLDVLPAIPSALPAGRAASSASDEAILISDTSLPENSWTPSNPAGYAAWFKSRATEKLRKAAQVRGEIADFPTHATASTLQRVVQLLKRHRDARYSGDDDSPISIIISTLAALAYDGESSILDATSAVISRMRDGIKLRGGHHWIANPTDPRENFADKWPISPRKAELFFEWLGQVEQFGKALASSDTLQKTAATIAAGYGSPLASAALTGLDDAVLQKAERTKIAAMVASPGDQFDVAYRNLPRWPLLLQYGATISARARPKSKVHSWQPLTSARPIPPGWEIEFAVSTSAPFPASVYWQVTNTGPLASNDRDLRGGFFPAKSAGRGGLTHLENTKYLGTHSAEAFIVQDGVCIARTGVFAVEIQE